jgi:hypothetical protein
MTTRGTMWAVSGVAAAVLAAGGFWGGKALPTSTATPQAETGTVTGVDYHSEAFGLRVDGTGQTTGLVLGPVSWRDAYGNWHVGDTPACMKPSSHGQRITVGIVHIQPVVDAPGGNLVTWLECARRPVPRYPVVTPRSSGSP